MRSRQLREGERSGPTDSSRSLQKAAVGHRLCVLHNIEEEPHLRQNLQPGVVKTSVDFVSKIVCRVDLFLS